MLKLAPAPIKPKLVPPVPLRPMTTVAKAVAPALDRFVHTPFVPVFPRPLPPPNIDDAVRRLMHAVNTSKATEAAKNLWSEGANIDATGRSGGAVTRNYKDVNTSNPFDDLRAEQQVHANRKLEAESLKEMTPEERRQYADLVKQTDGNPQARLALQLLAMQGKLTGEPLASDGQTLLSTLHTAASQTNAPGIDGKKLVCEMLRELATPSAISQGNRGTCGPTTGQIKLAQDNPAEYARIVGGLASERGEVTLANGDEFILPKSFKDPGIKTGEKVNPDTGALYMQQARQYGQAAHCPSCARR